MFLGMFDVPRGMPLVAGQGHALELAVLCLCQLPVLGDTDAKVLHQALHDIPHDRGGHVLSQMPSPAAMIAYCLLRAKAEQLVASHANHPHAEMLCLRTALWAR
jgi:hypothetical protein